MAEKIEVLKEVRKPVLDAARNGNPSEMDKALSRVGDLGYLEGIKTLAETLWKGELKTRADVLLLRITARMAALQALGPQAPVKPAEEKGGEKAIVEPTPDQVAKYSKTGSAPKTPAPTVAQGGGRGPVEPLPMFEPDGDPDWVEHEGMTPGV